MKCYEGGTGFGRFGGFGVFGSPDQVVALDPLADDRESEPVKAEALRELEEVTEFLRKSPWRSRGGAERCVRAVAMAIKRLHALWPGRWTPRAGRIRCCRALPGICTSTC